MLYSPVPRFGVLAFAHVESINEASVGAPRPAFQVHVSGRALSLCRLLGTPPLQLGWLQSVVSLLRHRQIHKRHYPVRRVEISRLPQATVTQTGPIEGG